MKAPSTFVIKVKTMLPDEQKPPLQELCGWYVAVTWLQFLKVNYVLLEEIEATEHLTHETEMIAVPPQWSWLKTMKLK